LFSTQSVVQTLGLIPSNFRGMKELQDGWRLY